MKTNLFFLIVIGFLLIPESSGLTQITPDNTLPNNSVVTPKGTTFVIEGGTQKGNNLFHSFQELSVPTGFGALFNNGLTIENIFSRVTGNSASFIDGMLSANGTANLFFLNPNGIIFGPNASLNLGGSFLATTASSFRFADGKEYSAITPNSSLLTDSSPVGLNFNANSGLIVVQGSGYNILEIPPLSPFIVGQHQGLKVSSGKTLALVGGNVSLEGGVLNAEAGRIELGAVEQGTANFKPIPQGWKFDYSGTTNFGNINISQLALVDTSGLIGGSVQLYGKQITIDGGGLVLIRNFGNQPSGDIFVKATDTFKIAGDVINSNSPSPLAVGRSSITTESLTQGKGGDIIVSTNNLIIQNGGVIGARGFGNAAAGNITLGVNDNIQLLDFSAINPRFFSGVSSVTVGSGNSGDVSVSARNLLATNGGQISASTLGSGNGGKIQVNVKDSIQLIGVIPNVLLPSSIGTSTLSSGDGGTLIIDTSRLIVRDGARIDTSSYSSGLAGNIVINASELIEVNGSVPGSINPAIIGSAVDRVDPVLQALFGLPQIPTGASGNITINSPQLVVKDNALVAVRNTGIGNAGNLTLNVPLITVENSGAINAATFSGEGGNITINSNDLRLLNNGEISATAGGSGNGGNININTDTLLALDKSSITANAFAGNGGNISINARGVLVSPDSTISASSQLGVDGTVNIKTPNESLQAALVPLSVELIIPESVLQGSCLDLKRSPSVLINSGTGGLPSTPESQLEGVILLPENPSGKVSQADTVGITSHFVPWQSGMPMLAANRILRLPDGRIVAMTEIPKDAMNIKEILCNSKIR